MAGIVFGILNGIYTDGWLFLVGLPILFGITAGAWRLIRGLPLEERTARESMKAEGREVYRLSHVPVLEGIWQALLALVATGATVGLGALL